MLLPHRVWQHVRWSRDGHKSTNLLLLSGALGFTEWDVLGGGDFPVYTNAKPKLQRCNEWDPRGLKDISLSKKDRWRSSKIFNSLFPHYLGHTSFHGILKISVCHVLTMLCLYTVYIYPCCYDCIQVSRSYPHAVCSCHLHMSHKALINKLYFWM